MLKKLCIFLLFVVFSAQATVLDVNKAFELSAKATKQYLSLDWQIASGYQLYQDSIHIKTNKGNQVRLGRWQLPAGVVKADEIRGKYQAYVNHLTVIVPLKSGKKTGLSVTVSYQGCKNSGYCYAPVSRAIKIDVDHPSVAEITTAKPAPFYLNSHNQLWQLLVFFVLGILLAFTPCVLPMMPIISSLIVRHHASLTTAKAFVLSLVYVLAVAITYAIAGLILALAGASVQVALQSPWVISVFALIFVVLSLSLFGLYDIRLPSALENALSRFSQKQQSGNYIGVAIMGVLSALIVSPCVSAPLIGALTFITEKGDVLMGVASLFLLGLGMGVPLLIVGVSTGKFLPKAGVWMDAIKALFGFILLGVAIYMLSRVVPGPVTLFLWGCLWVLAAGFFWFFKVRLPRILKYIKKIVCLLIGVYGVILWIGSITGHEAIFAPFGRYEQLAGLRFEKVSTVSQLNRALAMAKKQQKPVLLDFSARWCVECKHMKEDTFPDKAVQAALAHYQLIEVDLTKNDAQATAIRERYLVIGTPTLGFIDKGGQFLPEFNSVGFISPTELLQLIQRVNANNEN